MINNRLTRILEAIPNFIQNSTFLFPHRAKNKEVDIEHYPFSEKPLFLFIYHPMQLLDIICRRKCLYPIGHVASIYDGICIDSSSDFFLTIHKKGFFKGLKEAFQKLYDGRNVNPIGSTLRRIVQTTQKTKPFIFMLFPEKMGINPISLKQRMMLETMRSNDYYFLENNCATHSLRPILKENGIKEQFGNVITPLETIQWCDKLCEEGKAVRVSSSGLSKYLSQLQEGQANNLFGEKTNVILTEYLKQKKQRQ